MSQLPPLGGFSKKAEAYILPPKKKPVKKKPQDVSLEELNKQAKALFKQAAMEEVQKFNTFISKLNIQ